MNPTSISSPLSGATIDFAGWPDRLRKGVWPRSYALWLLALYFAFIVIRPWEAIFPDLSDWRFERVLVIAMVGVTVMASGFRARLSFQACTMLLFMAVVWLSAKYAYMPEIAEPVVTELFGMLLCYFFCVRLIRTPYQLLFIICCYVFIVAVYIGKSEWEYFVHGAYRYRMGVHRLQGVDLSYGHPNQFAQTVVYTLPFWYFLVLIRRELCHSWPAVWRRGFNWFLLAHFALSVSAVLLTRSRAGALGLAAFAILVALRGEKRAKQCRNLLLVGLVGVCTFFVLPTDMRLRIQSTWDGRVEKMAGFKGANSSAEGRWYGFLSGIEMFQHRPLLGVGIGNYKDYRIAKCTHRIYLSAHNLPGELLGELGMVGAVSFGLILVAIWLNWRKIAKASSPSSSGDVRVMRLLMFACRDCVVLLALASLSQHTLQRYHWYLIAAFGVLAADFVRRAVADESQLSASDYLEAPAQ